MNSTFSSARHSFAVKTVYDWLAEIAADELTLRRRSLPRSPNRNRFHFLIGDEVLCLPVWRLLARLDIRSVREQCHLFWPVCTMLGEISNRWAVWRRGTWHGEIPNQWTDVEVCDAMYTDLCCPWQISGMFTWHLCQPSLFYTHVACVSIIMCYFSPPPPFTWSLILKNDSLFNILWTIKLVHP